MISLARSSIPRVSSTVLVCTNADCSHRYRIKKLKPGLKYRCKRCQQPLEPPPPESLITEVVEEAVDGTEALTAPCDPTILQKVAHEMGQEVTVRLSDAIAIKDEGSRFGRYVNAETIARGGMGAIFRAHDPDLGRPVAIKVILSGEKAHREEIIRFLREAQITGQLVHPCIPPIHEMGQTEDGQIFFAMKLIEGKSLAEILKRLGKKGRPDAIQAARREHLAALVKVCDALAYAHDRGVIHRDGPNPSRIQDATGGTPVHPVERISWSDCRKVLPRWGLTLPSEARWEYACRGGTTGRYSFGDDHGQLPLYAWYSNNSGRTTHPVGEKEPNPFGLHDIHGNVSEWCLDTFQEDTTGAPEDGSAWTVKHANRRVNRGGSHASPNGNCACAKHNGTSPGARADSLAVRPARRVMGNATSGD